MKICLLHDSLSFFFTSFSPEFSSVCYAFLCYSCFISFTIGDDILVIKVGLIIRKIKYLAQSFVLYLSHDLLKSDPNHPHSLSEKFE